MKNYLKTHCLLAALALLGVLSSLAPLSARVRAEEGSKRYDLLLSYSSLQAMAAQSAYSEGEWLDLFRSWGVDKMVLGEYSVRRMSSNALVPIYGGSVQEIRSSHGWELRYPDAVAAWVAETDELTDTLVIVEDDAYTPWLLGGFFERVEDLEYRRYDEGGTTYLFFGRQSGALRGNKLLDLPVGVWPELTALAEAHGMQVIPRTETVDGLNGAAFARSFLNVLDDYQSPYFLNTGDSLLGYDDEAGETLLKDYLRETGVGVGMFEQNDQSGNLDWDGFPELLEATGYHAVRAFNEWPYIQNRYAYCGYEGPEEITNSLFRAVAERNCKLVYLTMILEPDNDVSVDADENEWTFITDPDAYAQMLGDLDARLTRLGYAHETVRAAELAAPSILWRVLEGIGAVAAAVLLLDAFCFLSARTRRLLLAAGIAFMAAYTLLAPRASQVLLSMAGGVVMPSLAATWLCRHAARRRREEPEAAFGKLLAETLGTLAGAFALSLCGALMASAALSQLSYMLEIDLYRGVKLMQLIPIGVFALAYLLVFAYEETGAKAAVLAHVGARGEKGRARRFAGYFAEVMEQPMKLGWLVAVFAVAVVGVFVLAAGAYYLYRTGNTTNVSARELALRNLLENLLVARPRTKELLIGYPCAMLFVWALRRHMNFLPLLFGGGMTIGLVSVVNTFLHIRTPFLMSLLRTGWGLLFGVVIGAAAVAAAELLLRLLRRRYKG